MSFTGTVENGVIKLPDGVQIPEGTTVSVQELDEESGPSFYERFKEFIGTAEDLPVDLADQVDHYVHGKPKR